MAVKIYTDGACSGNPGPGGYGVVWEEADGWHTHGGCSKHTTNNRMELRAFESALWVAADLIEVDFIDEDIEVMICMDSAYVYNAVTLGWISKWAADGWKTKSGKKVVNDDIWRSVYSLFLTVEDSVKLVKVKGHSGDEGNELADEIAVAFRDLASKLKNVNGKDVVVSDETYDYELLRD